MLYHLLVRCPWHERAVAGEEDFMFPKAFPRLKRCFLWSLRVQCARHMSSTAWKNVLKHSGSCAMPVTRLACWRRGKEKRKRGLECAGDKQASKQAESIEYPVAMPCHLYAAQLCFLGVCYYTDCSRRLALLLCCDELCCDEQACPSGYPTIY